MHEQSWDKKTLATPVDAYYAPNMLVHGVVRSDESGAVIAAGKRDWANPKSLTMDADTMLSEASVGKVRWAGLAYMLQQEGIIDIQSHARDFFVQTGMKEFLDRKYPGKDMQAIILKFFAEGNSDKARLIDFTTHMAGMGDLRMLEISCDGKGIVGGYTLADTLAVTGYKKPPARGPMVVSSTSRNFREDTGTYGIYQYSNIGYMLFAEAMEAAYFFKTGNHKNYQQLLQDFMLHPIEGYAAGKGLNFGQTKFAKDLSASDNVCVTHWKDKRTDKIVLANVFDGHLGAVGPLSSHNDSVHFFAEYFKGFPGTSEYGKCANKFFTESTIEQMRLEWGKYKLTKDELEKSTALPPHLQPDATSRDYYQGPAFIVEVDKTSGEVLSYHKSGIMFGCHKFMEFVPKTGIVHMVARATENISPEIAKEAGIGIKSLMAAFVSVDGTYDRCSMLQCYKERGIEAIQARVSASHAAKVVSSELSNAIKSKL